MKVDRLQEPDRPEVHREFGGGGILGPGGTPLGKVELAHPAAAVALQEKEARSRRCGVRKASSPSGNIHSSSRGRSLLGEQQYVWAIRRLQTSKACAADSYGLCGHGLYTYEP